MELLIHPTPIAFPAKISFTALKRTTQSSSFLPNSYKFSLHPPFSLTLPLSSSSRRFRISGHFGRPTNRQNHLRKKLTQHQQVSDSWDFSKQPSDNAFISKPDSSSVESFILGNNSHLVNVVGEQKSHVFGESLMGSKLEGWVDQYRKDSEFWGIGTRPIFTIFQDSNGNVERVDVNDDEILRRSRVDPVLCKDGLVKGLAQVNSKILLASTLAREMNKGKDVLPENSSVVKYVSSSSSSLESGIIQNKHVSIQPTRVPFSLDFFGSDKLASFRKVARFTVGVVCVFFVCSTMKNIFTTKNDDRKEYSRLEKEMLRRKIKARMNKEKNVRGDVEIIQDSEPPEIVSVERPPLDKEELMANIIKAKEETSAVQIPATLGSKHVVPVHFDDKIQEIREMARRAREHEKTEALRDTSDEEDDQILKKVSKESIQKVTLVHETSGTKITDGLRGETDPIGFKSSGDNSHGDQIMLNDLASTENRVIQTDEITNTGIQDDIGSSGWDSADKISPVNSSNAVQIRKECGLTNQQAPEPAETTVKRRFRIIQSVKEAREYLAKKHDEVQDRVPLQAMSEHFKQDVAQIVVETTQTLDLAGKNIFDLFTLNKTGTSLDVSESSFPKAAIFPYTNGNPEIMEKGGEQAVDFGTSRLPETDSSLLAFPKEKQSDIEIEQGVNDDPISFSSTIASEDSKLADNQTIPKKQNSEGGVNMQMTGSSSDKESINAVSEMALSDGSQKWIEKNFHELGPVIEKIGVGFRDNYMVAKEKTSEDMSSEIQMMQLISDGNGDELEWMQDERLREIVFNVRDNELAGRDPFYSITEKEKLAFFDGLEKKVEKENAKLQNLHKWLHSSIENLDYGADGIGLYDPPEKVIPRWKGPPVEKIHEFLKGPKARHDEAPSDLMKQTSEGSLSLDQGKEPLSSRTLDPYANHGSNPSATSRTIIEGSDGSTRVGKKSGKEYWQHTKRWSHGFLESYNAETDPEIKGVMKDVGKDLDRWITEKEIKEAADLMDKLPERGQKFIKEKLDRVKREMELFGPQAVVSKYQEYSDEKEKDYLWWLDLPFVLCIEMYTEKEGEKQVGFYSLEMAADLELDPKQYHVIAFEDAGDCKNMCYIIQAHMEMLRNGNAFVVAQRPKDAFREAKANEFGVTVLRKGELLLNVDQTLEEVEELIAEIGSKVYHDKIMRERSLDVSSMMKGVFGLKNPVRRKKSRRKLNEPPAKS